MTGRHEESGSEREKDFQEGNGMKNEQTYSN
jgi:hypothetical protein